VSLSNRRGQGEGQRHPVSPSPQPSPGGRGRIETMSDHEKQNPFLIRAIMGAVLPMV
jgi:hypothetical protein